jgi:radical SAM protein with 4Fe4S-binding SPASM domain
MAYQTQTLGRRVDGDEEIMSEVMEITVAVPCENRCEVCPQTILDKVYSGKRVMTLEDFKNYLSEIPERVRIDFCGFCEPFQNRDIAGMMCWCQSQGYKIGLYTTLLGQGFDAGIFKSVHFEYVVIHTPDKYYFKTDEQEWLERYRQFENLRHADRIVALNSVSDYLKENLSNIEVIKWFSRCGKSRTMEIIKDKIECKSTSLNFNKNVLLPNGDVYLCCMDYGLQHRLGNIMDGYERLFTGEEIMKVRKGCLSGDVICRSCENTRGRL